MQIGRSDNAALTAILASVMIAAWCPIVLGAGGVAVPSFCSSAMEWGDRASASLALALSLNPPSTRAAAWALMLAALMPPQIVMPLRHIRDRSFARRRGWAMALFTAGYVAIWMAAGMILQFIPLLARLAWQESPVPLAIGIAVALLWQVSPAKQYCLNRCHGEPSLAAFGPAADRDVLLFGLRHGAWCVGACWALMTLPLLIERGHVLAMTAAGLFLFSERLELPAPPGWRWRGSGKAVRIAIGQARMRLAPRIR